MKFIAIRPDTRAVPGIRPAALRPRRSPQGRRQDLQGYLAYDDASARNGPASSCVHEFWA